MLAPGKAQLELIQSNKADALLSYLYGSEALKMQKLRYAKLIKHLVDDKPEADLILVSAPGRTELGGNHTDHNNGCVLAAAVDLDCIAAITPTATNKIVLHSEQYEGPICVDITELSPKPEEQGKAEALVRGVAAAFYELTGHGHGFYGWIHSTCQPGIGLSTSAAFSVMVGAVLNFLCNENALNGEQLARLAHQAENNHFGKPCGMMDQMASALGGTIFIDFADPEKPLVEQIEHSFAKSSYQLALVDTGGSHVELTPEYASIPIEMKAASEALKQPTGRKISLHDFLTNIPTIRAQAGDRAALRLLHFIEENARVRNMANALRDENLPRYLQDVKASGFSSLTLLQNCATSTSSKEQGILLALAVSRSFCEQAISRVHGGGFAGTIQSYIPQKHYEQYRTTMQKIFGPNSVHPIQIGRRGVVGLSKNKILIPGER